jgi:hypothetical protein
MVREFGDWLGNTSLSLGLQNTLWFVPVSQSTHILSVAVLFTSAMFINLRLLGFGQGGRSLTELLDTHLPWMRLALAMLVITGVLQTITEPVRQFITPIYWYKMVLIVIVAILTVRFARTVRANAAQWNEPATRPASARSFALVSSALWITIVIFGRFIGYVWAYYL